MAFSKEKAHERAERHAARGQHDRAAREYQSIVDNDPKDIRAWLMLADCLARAGDRPGAVARYLQVAEFYTSQKAHQKALAVYRQVLTLEPGRLDIHFKTAQLNRELGRVHDAIASYEHIAQAQMQAGRVADALKTYRIIADADPSIVSKRLRLAELYSRENMVNEAVDAFSAAGRVLLETNRLADYVRVAERLLYHRADDRPTIRELARVYLKLGDARRALMKLNALLQVDQNDPMGLELLGDTFMAMGKPDKASSVMVELIRKLRALGREGQHDAIRVLNKARQWDPRNPELARLQRELEGGDEASADAAEDVEVEAVPEVELDDDEVEELDEDDVLEDLPDAAARSAEAVGFDARRPASGRAAAPRPSIGDADDFDKILFEAHVYVKYRLFDHALEHVQALLEQQPDHVGALSLRARALSELGRRSEAAATHVQVANLLHREDPKLAIEHLEAALECDPQRADAGALRQRIRAGTKAAAAPAAPPTPRRPTGAAFDLVDESETDFPIEVADLDEMPDAGEVDRGVAAEERFAMPTVESDGSPAILVPDIPGGLAPRHAIDIGSSLEDRLLDEPSERFPVPPTGERDALSIEIEEVDDDFSDFELDPEAFADVDIHRAEEPPARPETPPVVTTPTRVAASSLLARTPPKAVVEPEPAIEMEFVADLGTDLLSEPLERRAEPTSVAPEPEDLSGWPDISDELAEIRFFIDQGLEDDAQFALADLRSRHPGHPLLRTVQIDSPGLVPEPPSANAGAAPLIDLASEEDAEAEAYLSAIFSEEGATESVSSKSQVAVMAGLEEADPRDLFDLGTAMREMGLIDESIRQFEAAAKDPAWRSRALTMAGTLRVHRGETKEAVAQLKQAVTTATTEDERCEAAYELARVYETLGDTRAAIAQLRTVTEGYRDRDERLRALLS